MSSRKTYNARKGAAWLAAMLGMLAFATASYVFAQTTLPAPTIETPANGAVVETSLVTFGGTAQENTTLVASSTVAIATTSVPASGAWEVDVALPAGTSTVLFAIHDTNAASATTSRTIIVSDTTEPAEPTIITPTDGAPVRGEGEPGAIVQVTTESGAQCTAVVGPDGSWECTLDRAPVNGESIGAALRDSAGNTSSPAVSDNGIDLNLPTEDVSRGFLREGIFGCNAGEYAMGVGTLSAIGGVYVPVNDAAVTMNSGYLIYKECTLDGITTAMREAASTALVRSLLNWFNTGDNGNPMYITNLPNHLLEITDQGTLEFLKDYRLNAICAPFKTEVKRALAQDYLRQTRQTNSSFSCTTEGIPDPEGCRSGVLGACGGLNGFFQMFSNPANTPLGAYNRARLRLAHENAVRAQRALIEAQWSNGILGVTETIRTPTATGEDRVTTNIVTPGFVASRILEQTTGSGFRQLESADEVDQIVGALFSGITNQIVTSIGGLDGLSRATNGRPPYLNQLSSESSSRVRQSATNAALQVLNSTVATENEFAGHKQAVKDALEEAKEQFEEVEAQCWPLIIAAVEEAAFECRQTTTTVDPETGEETETCALRQAIPITIATSTQFSAEVIEESIEPLETVIDADLASARNGLSLLQNIVADITNTASLTVQRIALERLDTLIANRAVHNVYDVKTAQQQRESAEATINTLVEDTVEEWGSGTGWCNVENEAVVRTWIEAWRTDQ